MYSSVLLHSLCCAVITISITFLSPQTETLYQPLNSPFSHLQPLVTSNHLHIYEVKVKVKVTQSCPTLCNPMNYLRPHELCSPWNSPGQNTGVGSLSLLQGIFPTRDRTQVSNIAGRFFTS